MSLAEGGSHATDRRSRNCMGCTGASFTPQIKDIPRTPGGNQRGSTRSCWVRQGSWECISAHCQPIFNDPSLLRDRVWVHIEQRGNVRHTSLSWNVYSTASATAPMPPPCICLAHMATGTLHGHTWMQSIGVLRVENALGTRSLHIGSCLTSPHPND